MFIDIVMILIKLTHYNSLSCYLLDFAYNLKYLLLLKKMQNLYQLHHLIRQLYDLHS